MGKKRKIRIERNCLCMLNSKGDDVFVAGVIERLFEVPNDSSIGMPGFGFSNGLRSHLSIFTQMNGAIEIHWYSSQKRGCYTMLSQFGFDITGNDGEGFYIYDESGAILWSLTYANLAPIQRPKRTNKTAVARPACNEPVLMEGENAMNPEIP